MAGTETRQPDRDRWPIWLGVALIVALLLVVVAVIWSSGVFDSNQDVRVPNVVDLSQKEATEKLEDARLDVERIDRTYSVRVSEGTVIAQTPSAGSLVPRGTAVTLEVARGVEEGTVPDVSMMDVEDALMAAEAAGYTVVVKEKVIDGVKPGSVLEQKPPQGEAQPGSTVTLVVAVGAVEDVVTPNVVGALQPAAVSIVHEAGLKARSYWVRSPKSRIVVDQYPPAGMLVARGTVVTLSVAAGYDDPSLPLGGIGP